jgi:hypothetical protein
MTIGRIARRFDAFTTIPFSQCYSSCALIFIGGASRLNGGQLGLHRPYVASGPKSREELEKTVPQMLSDIHDYVKEMRVTDRFYELMVNTEPSDLVILNHRNTQQVVPIKDSVWDERLISFGARKYGLTTTEMRKREQRAKACEKLDQHQWSACEQAINWGVSKQTYEERYAKAKSRCWFDDKNTFSPEDELALKSTPLRDRINQPFFLAWEKCVRNVMTSANR